MNIVFEYSILFNAYFVSNDQEQKYIFLDWQNNETKFSILTSNCIYNNMSGYKFYAELSLVDSTNRNALKWIVWVNILKYLN